jgi:hypothetical protein
MANSKRTCAFKECRGSYRPAEGILHPSKKFGWCGPECRIKWAAANAPKFKQKADRERKADTRRRKAKLNETDLKWQKKRTKDAVNELVRLLDANQPCIVCNGFDCGQRSEWDAGHYLTKAAHPELKFDPRNIHRQCSLTNTASNRPSHTEASIRQKFEAGIIGRYGMPFLLWLKGHHPQVKYTCEGLAAYRKEVAADVARVKRGEPPLRDWRAL